MKKKSLKNRFISNTGWVIGQQIVHLILALVVGMISARYLGPANYGIINYVSSFVTMLSSISLLGMESVVIKEIIEKPEKENIILGSGIFLRLISGIITAISVVIIVMVLNPGEIETIVVSILCSISLVFRSFELLDSWFQKNLLSKYTAIAKTVAYIVVSIYQIILLISSSSVEWFAFSTSLEYLALSIILYLFYRIQSKEKLKIDVNTGLHTLKNSYHFIISGLMVSIYGQMDKMMLKSMVDSSAVGLYSTASYICTMWIFIPTAIINSARPIILDQKKNKNPNYLLNLEKLYSSIIWICIVVSLFICIFSDLIILLLYGSEYSGSVDALKILIWSEVFSMIGVARGIWIVSENKNKYVKYYLFYGVVVNALLNWYLIPKMGIVGAGIATLITQITTSLIAPLFYKETRIHTKYVLESFVCKWYLRRQNKNIMEEMK